METTTIKVWDIAVRIFHWSLVITFIIAYLSGEGNEDLHVYVGYAVLALVLFRLIWGFIGSKYARFSEFLYSPSKVIEYLKSLVAKSPKEYTGHNPAGGWMIVALLISLIVTTVTGLKVYGVEGHGPLAQSYQAAVQTNPVDGTGSGAMAESTVRSHVEDEDDDDDYGGSREYAQGGEDGEVEELWEEIHEVASNFTVLLIIIHVIGVLVSGRLHGQNLVRAMITGRKARAS